MKPSEYHEIWEQGFRSGLMVAVSMHQLPQEKLIEFAALFKDKPPAKKEEPKPRPQVPKPPWLEIAGQPGTSISELNLTVRAENCLKAEGIETIEQLVLCNEWSLLKTPNLGRRSVNEIKEALELRGMKMSPKPWSLPDGT